MKLLVIGSGGREHALVWKLAQSQRVSSLWCAPGNAGMAAEQLAANGSPVQCANVAAENLPALLALAKEQRIDLTVVGPDNPLALGIVDLFQEHGLRIWGPNRKAAQFESSKAFSQEFMDKHGIPTARSRIFSAAEPAKMFAAELRGQCAVKADGLALGKGVLLCHSVEEAGRAIDEMLVEQKFGAAGQRVVIQELLEGMEISLHALCDGQTARLFPTSQDHKRIGENDTGPNTGGMGAYSPTPFLSDSELSEVSTAILSPWLRGCRMEGIDFRGVLYPGVMLTKAGPKVLEFNARFGDPEAQVYLMRLETDLLDLLEACLDGRLSQFEPRFRGVAVCVVMASGGYPGAIAKGKVIHGLAEAARLPCTKIFHAGTARNGDEIVTAGGRVLGVTACGSTLAEARDRACAAVSKIQFDGAQFRRDIAAKALRQ
ncbi:MAG TPA: phosphoribosylamine--glycine ligase [Verrucomicrobiae bacterium]|jgi:phosphoribosylamine--glycine ligase